MTRLAKLGLRLGPGHRARRSAHIARRRAAGHVPPRITPRPVPEPRAIRTGRLWQRVKASVDSILGTGADARQKRTARAELARFLGIASGADPQKKRRRIQRQQTQRRNR